MSVRLECPNLRLAGLQIKVLCGSAERNSLATKSEHARSVVTVRRTNRRPNRRGKVTLASVERLKLKWIDRNSYLAIRRLLDGEIDFF
jgi:hypothetical protein